MSKFEEVEKKAKDPKLRNEEESKMINEDNSIDRSNMYIGDDNRFTMDSYVYDNNTGNQLKSLKIHVLNCRC